MNQKSSLNNYLFSSNNNVWQNTRALHVCVIHGESEFIGISWIYFWTWSRWDVKKSSDPFYSTILDAYFSRHYPGVGRSTAAEGTCCRTSDSWIFPPLAPISKLQQNTTMGSYESFRLRAGNVISDVQLSTFSIMIHEFPAQQKPSLFCPLSIYSVPTTLFRRILSSCFKFCK